MAEINDEQVQRAVAKQYPQSVVLNKMCFATQPLDSQFYCTREKGHPSDVHVHHTEPDRVIVAWRVLED